ncbi:hypothetical protein M9Y10_043526 [Tritrichomonas musculus]|uniref:Initiator binding domain-containing protein n=1 Tax=Tritrichomonas musculus TaxID=1915356 RepID=A0ABR2K0B0_9EUKA
MKKEEENNWKPEDDFNSPIRIFSPMCSEDESMPIGQFPSSPLFDLFTDIDWKFPDKQDSPILPPLNQTHRRSRSKPIPQISQPLFNIPMQTLSNSKHIPKGSKSIDYFTVGQNKRPIYLPNETTDDDLFIEICNDKSHQINPHQLGFIPANFWLDESYQFGDIVRDFFHRKNHPSCRFSHKLFNALKLTESNKSYFAFTGVEWKSEKVLHVNKIRFARLLGIKSINGSLFHQQGNFPAFGFTELPMHEIQKLFGEEVIQSIDIEVDHYLIHSPGVFVSNCSEQDIADEIKWIPARKRAVV